jgi:hypothetical protein
LPRPRFTIRDDPVFQNTRLQPLPDQADNARIADAVLDEPNQLFFADRIEGSGNTLPISAIIRIM